MSAHGVARRGLLATLGAFALVAFAATDAHADALWRLESNAAPTLLRDGGKGLIIASASNLGDSAVADSGSGRLQITDGLPHGLRVPADAFGERLEGKLELFQGSEAESRLSCALIGAARAEVRCESTATSRAIAPYHSLRIVIPVEVRETEAGARNRVTISGGETEPGGAEPAPAELARVVTSTLSAATPFGIEHYELRPENDEGGTDALAGSHPFQLTTSFALNESLAPEEAGSATLEPSAPQLLKSLTFALPPGLLGDATSHAVARCSEAEFSTDGENNANACPAASAIGVALVTLNVPGVLKEVTTEAVPVFNLVPAPGEPARFGFEDAKVPVILDTAVRTGGDYGADVTVSNATQAAQILGSQVALWGEPESASHNASRGWACLREREVNGELCTPTSEPNAVPFLTLPSQCAGQLTTVIEGESWSGGTFEQSVPLQSALEQPLERLEDCESVPFSPTIAVQPVREEEGGEPNAPTLATSSPTGLNVTIKLPAGAPSGELGESPVRDVRLVLPEGVQVDPAAATGLEACTEAQVGYESVGGTQDPFAPGTSEPLHFSTAPAKCPEASKIGTVEIRTPDLENELRGGVYVAAQEENPFGSLFALYIVAEEPVSRILVKLAGEVSVDEASGQVTTTFLDDPQVPIEELEVHLFGGPHATLSTPAQCGQFAASAAFTAWSGATVAATSEPQFSLTSGPGGEACPPGALPFAPTVAAGSATNHAATFAPFELSLAIPDGDQALTGIEVRMPPGVAAMLANVTPCPEPPAGRGWECGPASEIGHSTASVGLGPEPYTLPGRAYLTTGYDGAPFGLLVQTPAVAGPYNLGLVDVRSQIEVNPTTGEVTVHTDPGPRDEALPLHLRGVAADIRAIDVSVDRPEFTFTPTSCEPLNIHATLSGAEGAAVESEPPYRATDCAALGFHPTLTASTAGRASRRDGDSLTVKVTSKGFGQADIRKVEVRLPESLVVRLETLRHACLASTFEANPAGCGPLSVVGTATVHTPVLRSPLSGDAYLVARGAHFPNLEFVLRGEGVTIVLDGSTEIHNGSLISRFNALPDDPFTTFETALPAGPNSLIAPNVPNSGEQNVDLCGRTLAMQTAMTAQDGATITGPVAIDVAGCKRPAPTRAQLLAKALQSCRARFRHSRRRRDACERAARLPDRAGRR